MDTTAIQNLADRQKLEAHIAELESNRDKLDQILLELRAKEKVLEEKIRLLELELEDTPE